MSGPPIRHRKRLNTLLREIGASDPLIAKSERHEARKIWRCITQAYEDNAQHREEFDLVLMQNLVIWRLQMFRHALASLCAKVTYADGGPEKGYTQQGHDRAPTDTRSDTDRVTTGAQEDPFAPPLITKSYAEAEERYLKIMKELLNRIRAEQGASASQPQLGLADILAPIIEKGKQFLDQSIEHRQVPPPPQTLNNPSTRRGLVPSGEPEK